MIVISKNKSISEITRIMLHLSMFSRKLYIEAGEIPHALDHKGSTMKSFLIATLKIVLLIIAIIILIEELSILAVVALLFVAFYLMSNKKIRGLLKK